MFKRPILTVLAFFLINPLHSAGREIEPGNVAYTAADPCPNCRLNAYFITLSGGAYRVSSLASKTIELTPSMTYHYNYQNQPKNNGTIELFLGVERFLEQGFKGQFGFEFAFIDPKFSGTLYHPDSPALVSNYSYDLNSARYGFKAKFLVDLLYQFSAYGSGSVGAAVNTAKNFTQTNNQTDTPALYQTQTQTNFAFSLGAGIERMFLDNWRFGIGYEFAGWGGHQLERAVWQTENHGLGNSLYTNTILLSLTFIV